MLQHFLEQEAVFLLVLFKVRSERTPEDDHAFRVLQVTLSGMMVLDGQTNKNFFFLIKAITIMNMKSLLSELILKKVKSNNSFFFWRGFGREITFFFGQNIIRFSFHMYLNKISKTSAKNVCFINQMSANIFNTKFCNIYITLTTIWYNLIYSFLNCHNSYNQNMVFTKKFILHLKLNIASLEYKNIPLPLLFSLFILQIYTLKEK